MPNKVSLALVGMISLLFMAGSCTSIAFVIGRWRRNEPLVPFVPRDSLDPGGAFSWICRAVARSRGGASEAAIPFGATIHPMGSDIRLGIVAFFFVFLPMILLHLYCQQFVPYEHAAITAIKSDRSSGTFLLWAIATVVWSPIIEEFLFRNLLQGVLEVYERMIVCLSRRWVFGGVPIVISSLTFALMHWNQGAAAAPLFLFALVLGFLYFQTHRLLPSIVAHAMLNLFTMLNLWFLR